MSRKAVGRFILVAASLLFSLGLSEALIRLFHIGPDIHAVSVDHFRLSENPVLDFELIPGSRSPQSVINSDGMRDREYPREKPPRTFRIACLGDSVAYGYRVDQELNFTSQLERILNRYFAGEELRFEVLNFSVSGYSLRQSVENLRVRALRYSPDLVLYAYCLNDPEDFSPARYRLYASLNRSRDSYFADLRRDLAKPLRSSRLFLLIRYAFSNLTAGGREPADYAPREEQDRALVPLITGTYGDYYTRLYDSEAWRIVGEEFDTLERLTVARDMPVSLLVFPYLLDLSEHSIRGKLDAYPLGPIHGKVAGAAASRGLDPADLMEPFIAFEEVFREPIGIDPLHLTPRGHLFTALAILRELLERSLIPGYALPDFNRPAGESDFIRRSIEVLSAPVAPPGRPAEPSGR